MGMRSKIGTALFGMSMVLGANASSALPVGVAHQSPAADLQISATAVGYRRGFPVYSLGPYPSGFGDEIRTGRPYYAGRSYGHRSYRHHYRRWRW